MWTVIYLLLLGLGSFAFVLSRTRASIYWISFYAAAIYSIPLAFGIDLFGRQIGTIPAASMCLVMLATLILAVLKPQADISNDFEEKKRDRYALFVAVTLSWAIFAMIPWLYGLVVFETHKTESGVGALAYVGWRISASVATIICILLRRHKLAFFAALPLGASLFAGDRTGVGLTVVAVTWLLLQTGRVRGMRLAAFAATLLAVGLFLFFGKTFQAQWISGTFVSVADLVRTVASQGSDAIIKTEPFGTMGVFNALVSLPFGPPDSVALSSLAQLFPMPSLIGFDSGAFNDFFQPILFPEFAPRSLAYSFWGEAYVRGGWIGWAGFASIFLVGLSVFDRLSKSPRLLVKVFAYLGGAYWSFYVHRNSLASLLAYERQIVLYLVAIGALAMMLGVLNRRINA